MGAKIVLNEVEYEVLIQFSEKIKEIEEQELHANGETFSIELTDFMKLKKALSRVLDHVKEECPL
ncbi:MAG: hypothetical protein WC895_04625 [Candidatus Shapirobacteria bacterium]|jgi:hypothetical protein